MAADIQHPGLFLLERYLQPLGIKPSDLAQALGMEQQRVSELVKGQSPITPDTAARLALYFDVPSRWWLEFQARYDAERLARPEDVRDEVTPYPGLSEILATGSLRAQSRERCKPTRQAACCALSGASSSLSGVRREVTLKSGHVVRFAHASVCPPEDINH